MDIDDIDTEELLRGMDELAYRHCWRCDPNDFDTKRLVEKVCDGQLRWYCPKCKNYHGKVK